MIIKEVTITNFQCYFDTQTVRLSQGVNIIIGLGGKGKSKFFNALYWALFGKIYITDVGWVEVRHLPQSSRGVMQKHQLFSYKALSEAIAGDSVSAGVKLLIEDDKNQEYEIERTIEAKRRDSQNWGSDLSWDISDELLKVTFDSHIGTQIYEKELAEDKIAELFPREIRNYIWFQGETINDLLDFTNPQTLKDAVQHISYYPFFEKQTRIIGKSLEKIKKLETAHLKEANKQNSAVKSLILRRDELSRLIAKDREEIERLSLEETTISVAIQEGLDQLSGIIDCTELIEKYNKNEASIRKANDVLEEIDKYQRKLVPNLWILRGIDPLIRECQKILDNYEESDLTEPIKKFLDNPTLDKLYKIRDAHRCYVCGSDCSEGTAGFKWVSERIKIQEEYNREKEDFESKMQMTLKISNLVGMVQDYPRSLLNVLSTIDKNYQRSEERGERIRTSRRSLFAQRQEIDNEIKKLKEEKGIDPLLNQQKSGIIRSKIDVSTSNLEKTRKRLDGHRENLRKHEKEFEEIEAKLYGQNQVFGDIKIVEETAWTNISVFLKDVCSRVQESASEDLLRRIQTLANDFYSKFTEKDSGYKGVVSIDEKNYSIKFDSLLNTSHVVRKKMSIINALLSLNQDALKVYYPFIADAPSSDMDPIATHHYLLGIKDIFHQSIICTKDVEIGSERYEDLKKQAKVSRIYELSSMVYVEKAEKPEAHEVSTIIELKK